MYALSIDVSASDQEIANFGGTHGLTMPIGYPGGRMVADFNIKRQSSSVALTPDGTVLYRSSYGDGSLSLYQGVFEELASLSDGAPN